MHLFVLLMECSTLDNIYYRSHTFAVRQPSAEFRGSTVHNLNVRGKRGNIVQVFPAVEYDFVPNTLEVMPGDFVHAQ